jgi:C-terminal processing protease CtpA/Prc
MPRLERAVGLVFDMRGYPRRIDQRALVARLTRETIQSAHFELALFSRPDRVDANYRAARWTIPPVGPRLTPNTVFLAGPGSMSAAESMMGIVEGHRLADIVGASTAGTNGDVNPFNVPGGYRVVFTGLRVRKHDGSPHHGVGIQPTIAAERTMRGVADGRDEVLERGLDVVAGRIR